VFICGFPKQMGADRSTDAALALLLLAGATVYVSLLPRNLGPADEAYFLYEAKRIRDGEVMYRDIFQFVTPLASYTMAALYWLFGTSMATARVAMAVVHGLTCATLYAACRSLGVRREVALSVPLAYLGLCQTVWPFASWHWFSTLTSALLALLMIAAPWAEQPRWAFVAGLVCGISVGIQQQRGAFLAIGAGAVVVIDWVLDWRYGVRRPAGALIRRLAYFAAGGAVVVVPLLAIFALVAGVGTMYEALVGFPLHSYGPHFSARWGQVVAFAGAYAGYTVPAVLRFSPLALLLPAAQWGADVAAGRERQRVRGLTVLIVLSICSACSIWYFPDLIHIGLIAGLFWVAGAVGIEWILQALHPAALSRSAGVVASATLAALLVWHLAQHARQVQREYPISHETAFGRVDFETRAQVLLVDRARELLAASPSGELFCYPQLSAPYLTTGGRNPTPYQKAIAGVFPQTHVDRILDTLESRRVPYIIGSPIFGMRNDPVWAYVQDHYEIVPVPGALKDGLPAYFLFGRKDRAENPAPPRS